MGLNGRQIPARPCICVHCQNAGAVKSLHSVIGALWLGRAPTSVPQGMKSVLQTKNCVHLKEE